VSAITWKVCLAFKHVSLWKSERGGRENSYALAWRWNRTSHDADFTSKLSMDVHSVYN